MTRYTHRAIWASAALALAAASSLWAAELRTTVANQTIRRTTYLEEPSPAKLMVMEPVSATCNDACMSCGIAGCNYTCLTPCRTWGEAEYLLWWRRGRNLPPLVTTSPDGTALQQAGVLGQPGTAILFGQNTYGDDAAPGGRATLGMWLDQGECTAIEGRFFALARELVQYSASSDGSPILARPFTNADALVGPLGPTSRVLAFNNIATNAQVNISSRSDVMGADAYFRRVLCDSGCTRIDLLAGYQFSRIDEDLRIADSFVDIDPGNLVPDGTRQDIIDQFDTRNEFHAGQVGLLGQYSLPCVQFEWRAKIGFGNMKQVARITGTTINDVPNAGGPVTINEGLLANAGNQGVFQQDRFTVAPEIGARLMYQVNDCFQLSCGYNFIYWSHVLQPGSLIDSQLNVPSQFVFADDHYWVHGLSFGAQFQF